MERTPEHLLLPSEQCCEALAFDSKQRNRRPIFGLTQSLKLLPDGRWQARRQWRGVGAEPIASEVVDWQNGLLQSEGEQPSLGETTRARYQAGAWHTVLRSQKTGDAVRERMLTTPYPAVTLGSMPLFIAHHWKSLAGGESMQASYLVLKVQRAATLRLQRSAATTSELHVSATPANGFWRLLFGSTVFVFDADAPRLRRIKGLLDPRDLRHNGLWREYLGSIEFATPLDLSGLVAAGNRS